MSEELFRQGGPLKSKRTGRDTHEFRIDVPTDEVGMVGRECTNENCSPGYFKVKPGTGITDGQTIAYCPYCRTSEEPEDFLTKAQKDYALALVTNEAIEGINRMVGNALGVGPSGKKKYNGGMFSMEVSYKPSKGQPVPRPLEEEMRRDITCPHCGLEHAVFGLATWCSDCGRDIFLVHVENEIQVVEKMLSAVQTRRKELGARVAGRDIENALEDIVSIFEAVMKVITARHLEETSLPQDEVVLIMEKKIRNKYQNIDSAARIFKKYVDVDLYLEIPINDVEFLKLVFEKRHPITHNLGVVDRKYLEKVRSGELEGREVRVSERELVRATQITTDIISSVYLRVLKDSRSSDSLAP